MDTVVKKSIEHLLALSEEELNDKDGLIASCMVKAIAAFSNINKTALVSRGKNMTQAKREMIATEMSRVLFYTGALAYLKDFEPDEFDLDTLVEFSQVMPEDYQNDTILCSMHGIQQVLDIVEGEFGPPAESDEDKEEDEELDCVALQTIFACIIILAERLDLDLEVVMANSGINQKI